MPPKKTAAKKTSTLAAPAVITTKKTAKKSGGKLDQVRSLVNTALKSTDWESNLDPGQAKQSLPHLPTGSIIIDHLIGGKPNRHGVSPCPGLPKGKILNLYGHESSGKCLGAHTLISTPDGLRTVQEIFAAQELSCTTANWTKPMIIQLVNGQGELENTTHFTANGARPLYGLRTFSGNQIRATANHPHLVMTERGFWSWRKAKDIRVGDVLVSRRQIPGGRLGIDQDRAYLLGVLVADGYLGEIRIAVSNDDPSIKDFLEMKAPTLGLPVPKQYPKNNPPSGQEPSIDFHFNGKASVEALYSSVGWSPGVAKDKQFGPILRCLDQDSLRAVLQGYFDCECYVDSKKGEIEVVSASHQLLRELSLLLRVFGILSLVREKKVAAYPDNEYWRLTIGGSEARKFVEAIGTRSVRRSAEIEDLRMQVDIVERSGSTNFDSVPNCGGILRDLYDGCETAREHHHMCADYMGQVPRARLTYDRLFKILEQFKDHSGIAEDSYRRLESIYQANYFYDEVVEVEEASAPEPTFDFAMEKSHSFVAEGFVTHNSTLALTAAATTCRNGGVVGYIDWEHEIVPDYAHALGVPIGDKDKFMLCQPDTLDDGIAILWTLATAGVDLIVLDSVGAGVPKKYFEKSIAETADGGRVGMVAAVWSQFLPKLKTRISKTHSHVIGISQIRANIDTKSAYGDTTTVQGGKAWKFYSALRMKLTRISSEKATDYSSLTNKSEARVIGAVIKAKLEKCKVSSQQGNEEIMYIRWGEGIDDLRSLIEIGAAHRVVKKGGSWIEWTTPDGDQVRLQGMDKFRAAILGDAKLRKALEKQVKPYMASGGKTGGDSAEEDDEVFDAEALLGDDELKDILGSISGEPDSESD